MEMKRTYDEPMMEVHHLTAGEMLNPATKLPVGGEGTPDANLRQRIADETEASENAEDLW